MPDYRFLVGDLLTGVLREEMPFSDVSYGEVLNAPGAFQATIGLRHPKATRTNLDPGRTAIYVERDGVLLWGGILWSAQADVAGATVALIGEGFWSYWRRRNLRVTKTYAATDQLAIAQDLLNWAQAEPGGDIGVIVGTETSGVLRDRTYNIWERVNIGQAIEQLTAVQNGFDVSIDVAYDSSGNITKTFRPSYPRRGRDTSIVLELGSNMAGLSQKIDATTQANRIDILGAGDGPAMLIATATDMAAAPPYPLLEDVLTYKDISVPATLLGHGVAAVTTRALPVETLPTVARAGPDTGVGSFITGDEITVRGEDGYVVVDDRMRIISIGVNVAADGGENVVVGCEPASDFV